MAAWCRDERGVTYVVRTRCMTEDGAIRNLLGKVAKVAGCIELVSINVGRTAPQFVGKVVEL